RRTVARLNLSRCAFPLYAGLQALGGEDAGDSGEIVGCADPGPSRCVEQGLDGRQAVMPQFQDKNAVRTKTVCRLRDQIPVEFVAFFAAVERDLRFVLADFAHQSCGFPAPYVGRIADDKLQITRLVTGAPGSSLASAIAMQPEPVPISAISKPAPSVFCERPARSSRNARRSSATSMTCSVSGRGISTSGVTSNSSPQNSCFPVRCCVGSPAARRRIN